MTSEPEKIIAEALDGICLSRWPDEQAKTVATLTAAVAAALRDAGMLTEPGPLKVETQWAHHDGDTWCRVADERRARGVGKFTGLPVANRTVTYGPGLPVTEQTQEQEPEVPRQGARRSSKHLVHWSFGSPCYLGDSPPAPWRNDEPLIDLIKEAEQKSKENPAMALVWLTYARSLRTVLASHTEPDTSRVGDNEKRLGTVRFSVPLSEEQFNAIWDGFVVPLAKASGSNDGQTREGEPR